MLKQLAVAGIGIAVGGGLVGIFGLAPPRDSSEPSDETNHPPMAALDSVSYATRSAHPNVPIGSTVVSRNEPTIGERAAAPQSSGAAPAPPAGEDEEDGGPSNSFRRMEADFYSETRDVSSASKPESLIVAIGQGFPETRVTSVECRTTLCRVVMTSPSIEAHNAIFRGIAEDRTLKQFGMVAEMDGDETTVYVRLVE